MVEDPARPTATDDAETVAPLGDVAELWQRLEADREDEDALLRELAAAPPRTSRRSSELAPGTMIDGEFRVERRLGRGGMGTVYLATDLALDRRIAIKLHDAPVAGLELSRVWREARAMARLSHPNVVTIYAVGGFDGRVYIAMEYVDGGTLAAWLAAQPRSWQDIVRIFCEAGRGLAAAHAIGIVHRDFKPANVLVGGDQRPRVADFGVARLVEQPADEPLTSTVASSGPDDITRTGATLGSPAYMAPEQFAHGRADARSDQFAYCVSLFEALYGTRPFVAASREELVRAIEIGEMRPRPSGTDVPARVHAVLVRGLHPDPAQRHRDLGELVAALSRSASGGRGRQLVLAGALATGIATTAVLATRPEPDPCGRADEPVERVWNDQRRAAITAAFEATGAPQSRARVDAAAGAVDRWTAGWRAMRNENCAATVVHATQSAELFDRRTLCLERRLAALDALLGVFERADRETVARALDVTGQLAPLGPCADVERLLATVAPPDDPALAAAVAAARDELSRARAYMSAGRLRDAIAIAEPVLDSDVAGKHAPLRAEALLVVGLVRASLGELPEAEVALEGAFDLAIEVGDDEVLAEAARENALVVGRRDDGYDEAMAWAHTAEAAARRVAAGDEEQVRLLEVRGAVTGNAGDAAGAETLLRAALARVDRRWDDGMREAALLDRIGLTLAQRGRDREAAGLPEPALAIVVAARGPFHPQVPATMQNLGHALEAAGDLGRALGTQVIALQRRIEIFGPENPTLPNAYNSVGITLNNLGAPLQARAYFESGLALLDRIDPDENRHRAILLANLSAQLEAAGDRARAVLLARESVARLVAGFGPRHLKVGLGRMMLGSVLFPIDAAAARVEYDTALEILEPALGPSHPTVALLLLNLGDAARQAGDHATALALIERADAAFRGHPSSRRMDLGRVAQTRAQVLRDSGDLVGALTNIERAVDDLGEVGGIELALALTTLGELQLAASRPREAIAALERGLELATSLDIDEDVVARLRMHLARALREAGQSRARRHELARLAHARFERTGDVAALATTAALMR